MEHDASLSQELLSAVLTQKGKRLLVNATNRGHIHYQCVNEKVKLINSGLIFFLKIGIMLLGMFLFF